MSYLETLMRYKQWANDLLFSAAKELTEAELTAQRSIVFGSILRTLNHTFAMDLVWQANLLGRPHSFSTRNPDECPSLEQLLIDQNELDEWFISYAEALTSENEDHIVGFTFVGSGPGAMTRRDILLHVVNHGTYHRGNVTGIMYDCSVEPPTTDYSVFLKQSASSGLSV
ncbi:MAG: DinB family protein [Pseudomonadota bacterium]